MKTFNVLVSGLLFLGLLVSCASAPAASGEQAKSEPAASSAPAKSADAAPAAPAGPVFQSDFESGSLDSAWVNKSASSGTVVEVTGEKFFAPGSKALKLVDSTDSGNAKVQYLFPQGKGSSGKVELDFFVTPDGNSDPSKPYSTFYLGVYTGNSTSSSGRVFDAKVDVNDGTFKIRSSSGINNPLDQVIPATGKWFKLRSEWSSAGARYWLTPEGGAEVALLEAAGDDLWATGVSGTPGSLLITSGDTATASVVYVDNVKIWL